MHDRQLEGQTLVFGNQGALYKTAMTWFDHTTGSIWSQPIGEALVGELRGATLTQLPSTLDTWAGFSARHPDALVLANGLNGPRLVLATPRENWVIGLALGEAAAAVAFTHAQAAGVVHLTVGDEPVLVWVDRDTGSVRAYLRRVADRLLTFQPADDGTLRDRETGSLWGAANGLAVSGPLAGEALSPVPWTSSFDWAWRDFYPDSTFIGG